MSTLPAILDQVDKNLPDSLNRLFEFIRIPSISTSAETAGEVRRAASWSCDQLTQLGFEASVRETDGLPMVVGHQRHAGATKHVLFYGHYDVQPVDPLALWETDPFEPEIVSRPDGSKKIVARGSSDDKGQLMTFVEACRAYQQIAGSLPLNITVLLEGEEETGSPSMNAFLAANRDELTADIGLVCDTSMWDANTPALSAMLRGLAGIEVTLKAANRDLHSGLYGGAASNPIHILADIVAALHDENGAVTLPGFYDGVQELPAEIKAQWADLPFDPAAYLGNVGLSVPSGEQDRSVLEQIWSRPTCEVNGFTGGYGGDGTKTVIPAEANVKLSFRLVGEQDPVAILDSFRQFVTDRVPADCEPEFQVHGASKAIRLPLDRAEINATRQALNDEWGREAVCIGMGGSIPIVGAFQNILGMDSILTGFSLDDDCVHSPNEKYEMKSFHKGIRSWARIIDAIART